MSRAVVALGRGLSYTGGAAISALAFRAVMTISSSVYVVIETAKVLCELGVEKDKADRVAKVVAGTAEAGGSSDDLIKIIAPSLPQNIENAEDAQRRIASVALGAVRKTTWAPFFGVIAGAVVGFASVKKIFSRIDEQDRRISNLENNLNGLVDEVRQQRNIFHSGPVFASEGDITDFCTCPITLEIIDDPVYVPEDRQLIERAAFERLYNENPTRSPLGRLPLGPIDSYAIIPLNYIRTLDEVRRRIGLTPSLPTREGAQAAQANRIQ